MFGIFKKKSFLGVDIGASSIKIVELEMTGGKPYLSNYAWMNIGDCGHDVMSQESDSIIFQSIKRSVKVAKIKSKSCNVAIPAFGGLITLIEFPKVAEDELEQAIRFEAHKYIPTSLDDVVFSWDVVGEISRKKKILIGSKKSKEAFSEKQEIVDGDGTSEKMQVLLVAAPKNKVERYEKIIDDSGLKLDGIEIESFPLVRSLIGNDQGNFVIVDIGSRVCNIVLVEKGVIKVNRNIDAGGKDITKTVARSAQVDEARAEKMKMSNDFFVQNSGFVFPVLDVIFGEINRVINSYYGKDGKTKIDSIILSGGTAHMPGIGDYFFKSLGMKIVMGNPFSRIGFKNELSPVVKKIGSSFSVAIGLALRGGEKK